MRYRGFSISVIVSWYDLEGLLYKSEIICLLQNVFFLCWTCAKKRDNAKWHFWNNSKLQIILREATFVYCYCICNNAKQYRRKIWCYISSDKVQRPTEECYVCGKFRNRYRHFSIQHFENCIPKLFSKGMLAFYKWKHLSHLH